MPRKSIRALMLAATAAACLVPGTASAQTGPMLLSDLFSDRAMFQRDRPIPIWGQAQPGERVTLEFAGKTTTARADRSGRWTANLPAQPAGGPFQLVASTPRGARETVADILVGDVWLCSGQSNMEYEVSRALNAPSEIGGASDQNMRLLTVGRDTSFTPVDRFKTPVRWQAASPASVADFSAACYFMGRDLRRSQNVPIGLIDASWGGTAIDAWRSEAGIARAGKHGEQLEVLRSYRVDPAAGNRRWGALWENWWSGKTGDAVGAEPWRQASGGSGWKPVPRLANWESWGDPQLANFNGMMWYRTRLDLTPAQAAQGGVLDIGWADDLDQTWVNGVAVGNTNGPNASRAYVLPPGLLKAGENWITVNVLDTYSAGGLMGPEELRAIRLADGSKVPLGGPWEYQPVPNSVGWPPRAPWETIAGLSLIYNGMVAPLGRYGLRGVAWYQGESDASTTRGYADKLASMMADWRSQFAAAELPFLVVQLAGWGPSPAQPQESGFATLRDEQRRAAAADRNAALAVAIDLGDRVDIHPANKQDVGHRLSRAARNIVYGERVTPSGPEVVGARRAGDTVVVDFRNVEGKLLTYNPDGAMGFDLCGDGPGTCRFVPAAISQSTATLRGGEAPATRVRFCWGDSPVCNLYDAAGLPAGPFEVAIGR